MKKHEEYRIRHQNELWELCAKGKLFGISNKIPENEFEASDLVKENYMNLKITPDHFITEKMCVEVLEENSYMLFAIPEKFLNEKIYATCFIKNMEIIKEMPEECISYEMIKKILEKNSLYLLESIPETRLQELGFIKDSSGTSYIDLITSEFSSESILGHKEEHNEDLS